LTTASELQIFLAILIHLGVLRGTSSKVLWWQVGNIVPEPMCRMKYIRFQQLKCYLHISNPSKSSMPSQQWWIKLEPLNSSIQKSSKECFLLFINVAIDEMMIHVLGCSAHTIKMPNKPINLGYKVLALCDAGYTYDW
ncbi:hypothetical protein C7212DRAFT_73189, partial [Tuber magnatum]